jgi:translation initiation factor IF-1
MAGRPKKDISLYRDEILKLLSNGQTYENIRSHLIITYKVTVSSRTFAQRLAEWGVKRKNKPVDSSQLRIRISTLFFNFCLEDKDMLRVLHKDGYEITARVLRRIRKDMGLLRRRDAFNQEEADRMLLEIVQKELDKGHIEGYGRGNLYTYFRSQMHIVSRYVLLISTLINTPADFTKAIVFLLPFAPWILMVSLDD